MDELQTILENIRQSILKRSNIKETEKKLTIQSSYSCDKCQDRGYIYNPITNSARICDCEERKRYQKMLMESGISKHFQQIGFKEFETETGTQKNAKNNAIDYVKNFSKLENEKNNSIAFLGNCGSGKTHLSIAIANNLMAKNIGVLYMPYREVMTRLKQLITDDIAYETEINKYKTARILLIDDFAKGKTTESDVNIMFEIINYRYLNSKPIIISSELTINKLLDFDEAVGSRIIEMCKGRTVEIIGIDNNYRLRSN